jgi:hypothetical protein
MAEPIPGSDPERPSDSKWTTIAYAIKSWKTTVRLLTVIVVMAAPAPVYLWAVTWPMHR